MALSSSSISSVGQLFSMKRKIAEGEIDEAGSRARAEPQQQDEDTDLAAAAFRRQQHEQRRVSGSCRSPGVQNPERDRLGAGGRQDDMAGEDIDELVGERGAIDRIGPRFDSPMIRIGGAAVVLAESFAERLSRNQASNSESCTFGSLLRMARMR